MGQNPTLFHLWDKTQCFDLWDKILRHKFSILLLDLYTSCNKNSNQIYRTYTTNFVSGYYSYIPGNQKKKIHFQFLFHFFYFLKQLLISPLIFQLFSHTCMHFFLQVLRFGFGNFHASIEMKKKLKIEKKYKKCNKLLIVCCTILIKIGKYEHV